MIWYKYTFIFTFILEKYFVNIKRTPGISVGVRNIIALLQEMISTYRFPENQTTSREYFLQ